MSETGRRQRVDFDWSRSRKLLGPGRESLFTRSYLQYLARDFLLLKPGLLCADMGTGLGFLALNLVNYVLPGGKFIGVDNNDRLLRSARRNAKKLKLKAYSEFHMSDANSLKFESNSFDRVMCQTLMQHLSDPKQALSEMTRVTKPGGYVVCIEPNIAYRCIYDNAGLDNLLTWERWSRALLRGVMAGSKRGFASQYIARELPKMMHDLGLTDIQIRTNETVTRIVPGEGDERAKRHYMFELKGLLKQMEGASGAPAWLVQAIGKRDFKWVHEFNLMNLKKRVDLLENDELFYYSVSPLWLIRGRKGQSMDDSPSLPSEET